MMQEDVERPLVEAGLVPAGFGDSWALNMYHDGSQGIQPHFDDAARFERPVYSLRLFSDSRLSFGTQLYGYTNGAFCVDMPRGAITIMHKSGYAVSGAKHCVRPVDLSGEALNPITIQWRIHDYEGQPSEMAPLFRERELLVHQWLRVAY